MKPPKTPYLSKREQQIMDVLYARGSGTANEVMNGLTDSPSNATVRKLLRILEDKGQIDHVAEGATFIYRPKVERASAAKSAVHRLVQTFFGGSLRDAVATLIDADDPNLTDEELDELRTLIEEARKRKSRFE